MRALLPDFKRPDHLESIDLGRACDLGIDAIKLRDGDVAGIQGEPGDGGFLGRPLQIAEDRSSNLWLGTDTVCSLFRGLSSPKMI